jgi:flagellar hook-associated protein FlgK
MIASDVFVLNFFWKYVDYRINLIDLNYLKSITPLNQEIKTILDDYNFCFDNDNDLNNFHIVFSQMSIDKLEMFIKFYMNVITKINHEHQTINNIDDLKDYIDSEFKFKTLIVCLYYYF